MRFLIAAVLVLSCSLCMAEDFPEDTNEIKSLTAEQAAKLVGVKGASLSLNGLTSIDKDVAQELAKFEGWCLDAGFGEGKGSWLYLDGLTSIDKDVAAELVKFKGKNLVLSSLTSIDKDVAQELGKSKAKHLYLSAKALKAYEEVNGKSPSVMAGGFF